MQWLLDRVRRPAYTGENRCTPCTVLNLLVAATLSIVLAVVSPGIAVLAFAVSVVVIYLRGYLVPGTPTITARYFPEWVLELFGKESVAVEPDDRTTETDLLETCEVVEAARGDNRRLESSPARDRKLDPAFRGRWNEEIRRTRDRNLGREAVADTFGVDADAVSAMGANGYLLGDERLIQWPSDAALAADVAAGRELRDCCPGWDEQDVADRLDALTTIRTLRRDCPACGESLSRIRETVESCCQPSVEVVSAFCEECGAQLAEMRVD